MVGYEFSNVTPATKGYGQPLYGMATASEGTSRDLSSCSAVVRKASEMSRDEKSDLEASLRFHDRDGALA
jgi:hypothetical protein